MKRLALYAAVLGTLFSAQVACADDHEKSFLTPWEDSDWSTTRLTDCLEVAKSGVLIHEKLIGRRKESQWWIYISTSGDRVYKLKRYALGSREHINLQCFSVGSADITEGGFVKSFSP